MLPERYSREVVHGPNDEVLQMVQAMRRPLFTALANVMGNERARRLGEDKRWALCGPASVTLTRVINSRTGIPIRRDGGGKRLELAVALYDPPDETQKIDHTYVRYYPGEKDFLGREVVYSIDAIYAPLFHRKGAEGQILVERHTVDTIDANLSRKYFLFPPQHDPEYFLSSPFFVFDPLDPGNHHILPDLIASFHDDRITQPHFVGDSGRITDHGEWSLQIVAVIKELIPDWNGIVVAPGQAAPDRRRVLY